MSTNTDAQRDARNRLLRPVPGVRLCSHQTEWAGENPELQRVEPFEGQPDGARHFCWTFPIANPRVFMDVANGEHEDTPSFTAMLYAIGHAYNLGFHGITGKRLTSAKGNLERFIMELTDKDAAVTIFHEIISLPRALLKPGELCRSAPNDAYLRVWVFAPPHEGGDSEDVNSEALDIAVKLNVIWASLAVKAQKSKSKKTISIFDSGTNPQFALDKILTVPEWLKVAQQCVDLPGNAAGLSPTVKNMGVFHPELLLSMWSPVFKTPLPERTGVSENVRRARLRIQRRVQDPSNYEHTGAQRVFAPLNAASFHRLDVGNMCSMNQPWHTIAETMTPNRAQETNPAMLVATPCCVKLQARTKHEPLLGVLKRQALFRFNNKTQAHFHTENEEWLLLRAGATVNKRKICENGSGTHRHLFDCLHDTAPPTLVPADELRNVLNRRCTFRACPDLDAFLRATQAWNGNPQVQAGVPFHIMQMNARSGRMENFVHPDYDDLDNPNSIEEDGDTAPAVVVLLPHHMDWRNREILRWALNVLSRSHISPKPFFLVDTLQGGASRGTVLAQFRKRRKHRKRRKRRKQVASPQTQPLSEDAEQVSFAMHFALPDASDGAARDVALERYCLEECCLPSTGASGEAGDVALWLPVFFEALPAKHKLPAVDDGQFVCTQKMLTRQSSAAQRAFLEHLLTDNQTPYSVGPDHTRAEPQTTTLARIAFDEMEQQYGPEQAMKNAGLNYAVHVVNNTQKNHHTEQMMQWFFANMERKDDGDWVAKKTTKFPQICRGDPDFFVEDALEAAKQQWFVQKGVYRNHFLVHLLWCNFMTALVEVESNEMQGQNPCGAIAIVARPGWGKSFMVEVLKMLMGPEHFSQAANKSAAAGQGVCRDTGENKMIYNDEFAFYMSEEMNGALPRAPCPVPCVRPAPAHTPSLFSLVFPVSRQRSTKRGFRAASSNANARSRGSAPTAGRSTPRTTKPTAATAPGWST